MRPRGDASQLCKLHTAAQAVALLLRGGVAQGHTGSLPLAEPSQPSSSLAPMSLRQRSARMRRGQFGFGDPAEREIQILFRNAVSPGSGPSNPDRETGHGLCQ